MALADCRVVLVQTHYPGNLGAAARAMRNFGLRDLVLVSPFADPADREARRLSTHGEGVLESARIVSDLGEAVADCGVVLATSARTDGLYRKRAGRPDVALKPLVESLAADTPTAIVFGPEPSGLTTADVARCHGIVTVPVDPEYPALNLGQAVGVVLYELRKQWYDRADDAAGRPRVATFAEQERAYEHLREGLEAIHFLYGEKAEPLMHAVRQLIGRAGPTPEEVRIVHGLARQLLHVAGKAPLP